MTAAMTNQLYYGDNLSVLREHIGDASVDLVYLDPPFNSNAGYNVLFKSASGAGADASIEAFDDINCPTRCRPAILATRLFLPGLAPCPAETP